MSRIVVGVSGKVTAHPAIAWAARYAEDRNHEVELVHVIDVSWGTVPLDYAEKALLSAEHNLRGEVARIQAGNPLVRVRSKVVIGIDSRDDELVKCAEGAAILVVGSHALERFGNYTFSIRAARIAAAAPCTVVVVPTEEVRIGEGIVVGVDGSEASAAAVDFAAEEADRFGETLSIVYAWSAPEPWSDVPSIERPTDPHEQDRLIISEALAGVSEQYPDLKLVPELITARPFTALYAASVGARMLVVGTHGRRGLSKWALGSVSEEMILSMPCQVAVARPPK